jgi:hypothetical protein
MLFLKLIPTLIGKSWGVDSTPANTKLYPIININTALLIKQSHTHALDARNTADNKYNVVTVRGFTVDGYAKWY